MTGENSQQKSEMGKMAMRFALGSSFAHFRPISALGGFACPVVDGGCDEDVVNALKSRPFLP